MKFLNWWFGNTELESEPSNQSPIVSDNVQQTLARLLGFDETNNVFRLLRVDNDGRLHITTDRVIDDNVSYGRIEVTSTAAIILQENDDRNSYVFKNISDTVIYIGFDDLVTTSNGFPINPTETYSDDSYVGVIYAVHGGSGNKELAYMEFS